jgi:4-amino-4-deoxy-L-arabinose transferase-like glycosyltransferase
MAVAGVVHARGMSSYPGWVDDPGTYLSQAWAFAESGALSPYTYTYDHAPGGWMLMGAWAWLTAGFERHSTAIGFGNECMLLAKLASVALLFALGRRLGFRRPLAALGALLFALSPLALTYTRWTFLDNLVTPWLLLAFLLAYSRRHDMLSGIGAGVAFALAALTKETALIVAPAFVWALLQNSDRRNRWHVVTLSLGVSTLVASLYFVYAITKSELLPGPGHVSLLGTANWQLAGRETSGSVLDAATAAHGAFLGWLDLDPWLLAAGAVGAVVATTARSLRPLVVVLLLTAMPLVSGMYLPAMHVVNLLPWCALLAAATVELLLGNRVLHRGPAAGVSAGEGFPPWRRRLGWPAVACLLTGVLILVTPSWASSVVRMTSSTDQPPLAEATGWIARNVPRDGVVVVHDAIWTDLVVKYGFAPRNVVMVYKLDSDPAVRAEVTHVNYIAIPDSYYSKPDTATKVPTLIAARDHALPVAQFGGNSPDRVTVWRVASTWNPRS